MPIARLASAAFAVASLAAVAQLQNPRNIHNRGPESFTTRVVIAGLADPWEVTWGPDGHLWITERTGFAESGRGAPVSDGDG